MTRNSTTALETIDAAPPRPANVRGTARLTGVDVTTPNTPNEQQERAKQMAARLGEQAQAAANVLAEAIRPSIPAIKRLADALANPGEQTDKR